MGMLEGLKQLLGPDKADKLRPDLSNGRIFFERTLLAERTLDKDTPIPRMAAVNQILPHVTHDEIMQQMQKAMDERDKARKGP